MCVRRVPPLSPLIRATAHAVITDMVIADAAITDIVIPDAVITDMGEDPNPPLSSHG